jgi:hypothetical protein
VIALHNPDPKEPPMFREYPGFKIVKDEGIKKPKGARKQKSELRVRRHAVAHTGGYDERVVWLRPR